ncbi:RluA family pseudouridine synthase [Clostridium sp. AN503]|uniref:RluA family pseudouridine synthase n=1 Tax=Clostridium sp. AN503 TaxID=3160598 RepID=UPI003458B529
MTPVFHYSAPEAGMTVEDLLLANGYSRRLIIDLKKSPSGLTIDKTHVYVTRRMEAGEVLTVQLPRETVSHRIVPTQMPLDILYEDRDILVVNKAANVPIHPSQGHFSNSLANGMAWYFAQKGDHFTYRVINRLDRDTTGLLILAKHGLSACILSDMVKTRQIRRTYLAAVSGDIRQYGACGVIDAPIARVDGSTIERQVDFIHGEPAVTHYRFLSYHPGLDASLLELQLETGRTHQIRVHMKHTGYPLFGDFLYHPDYRYIGRQSLHSWKLAFSHPITKEPLSFTAAVPEDMQIFICAGL